MTLDGSDWAELSGVHGAPMPSEMQKAISDLPQPLSEERLEALSQADLQQLARELWVTQARLTAQNEALRTVTQSLALAHRRYFRIYDLAPVACIRLSGLDLIQEANAAAAALLGIERDALIGRCFSGSVLPEDASRYHDCCRQLRETQVEPSTCELRLRRADGEHFWASIRFVSDPGEPDEQLAVVDDISDHKRVEQLQHEVLQRKDQFFATLGHELRNPLSPIRQVAEALRYLPSHDVAQRQRVADILLRQVDHLTRMVDDLLDVARIGRDAIQLEMAPCDLNECLTRAVEQMRPMLIQVHQRLDVSYPSAPLVIHGDAVRLAQLIVNLLRNASQFSAPESVVSVSLARHEQAAMLEVSDQGVGIAPELLSEIFEPFVRGQGARESARGGLGIGLALVRHLAELHGGQIAAFSAGCGKGATFRLTLPLLAAVLPPASVTPMDESAVSHRILLVEDDADVADVCIALLEHLGQEVERASDGPAALALVERLRPDLILLDLGLPGMDGIEVAQRLRQSEPGRAARLVAITGHGQAEDFARTQAVGFDEHLLKPLGLKTLAALLQRCR